MSKYIENERLQSLSSLDVDAIKKVTYSERTNDVLIEAIKIMVASVCNNDAKATTIKNVNLQIEKYLQGGNQ
jgi:hypothetical protein